MQSDAIWLDKLPFDVCLRIAASAQVSDHRSALNLAKASPVQQAVLKNAMQYNLNLCKIAEQCYADVGDIRLIIRSEENASDGTSEKSSHDETDSCSHDNNSEQSSVEETHHSSVEQNETLSAEDASDNEDETSSVDEREHTPLVDAERLSGEGNETLSVDNASEDENETSSVDEREQSSVLDAERSSVDGADTSSGDHGENRSDDERNNTADDEEQNENNVVRTLHIDYAALLGDDTRHICVDGAQEDIFAQPSIQSCLASESLLNLSICNVPDSLHSTQYAKNIRALELSLDDCDLLSILRGFSSPQLRELRLQTTGEKCLHKHFADDPQSHAFLAGLFPSVEVLALECAFCGEEEKPPWFLWNVMDKFANLREVTISEIVPDSAIERLSNMDRITLIGGDAYPLAEKIPDRIISITSSRLWTKTFSRRVILFEWVFEKLARCSKLEEIICVMAPDALGGLVRIASNLRSLGVAFQVVEQGEGRSERGPVRLEPKYGVLLDVVKSAPFLKSLRLINMRIHRSELRELLIAAGKRLEEFEEEVFVETYFEQFCSHGQYFMFHGKENKQELEEFTKTLRTAALHSPKLKKLNLDLRAGWFTDLDAVEESIPEIIRSYNVLRRHAVGLDVRHLNQQILKFVSGDIGLLDVMPSMGLGGTRIPGGAIFTF